MNDKTKGVVIAVLAVVFIIAIISGATALLQDSEKKESLDVEADTGCAHDGSTGMMGSMMHGDMEEMDCGEAGEMGCTDKEIEEMDLDGDGICDDCGMNVEMCETMKEMHKFMDSDEHNEMHNAVHGDESSGSGAGCH